MTPSPFIALALVFQIPSFPPERALLDKTAGELVLERGRYGDTEADWGWLLVPENRADPETRTLRLAVVRQRATQEASEPPLFNLVGGPGASNVFGSGEIPAELLRRADVVRVGYRGIDGDVELRCPEFVRALQTEQALARAHIERARAALRACHERLSSAGIDLDGYDLVEVADDIEAARAALGYERLDFLAVSFGTQIALTYCARHPDRVRRMLLIGAGGRARGFDLWDPELVERKLARYGELWKEDPEAAARAPDVLATVRAVLGELPREWNGVRIDRDKVRLGLWHMLRSVEEAPQALEAFVAAAEGDWAGLALLSWGYDEEQRRRLADPHGEYLGEFFAKVVSSGLDVERDWIAASERAGALLGSPAQALLWGAAARGGWPAEPVAAEFRRDAPLAVEALLLSGDLDFASPHEYVERELLPTLARGRLVVLEHIGHADVARLQPAAFEHAAVRFFREGVVDTSRFTRRPIDFTPRERLGDLARRVVPAAR